MGSLSQSNSSEPKKLRIGILGTGRVARAIMSGLRENGILVTQLIGRDRERREMLGKEFDVKRRSSLEDCDPELDLLLIAVSDDAIEEASEAIPPMKGLLAHTSGTRPLDSVRNGKAQGVFYPLQSFSSKEEPDWNRIPICVEASGAEGAELLMQLGKELSETVHLLKGEDRQQLHLAAVIACNFTNHLYGQAYELLESKGIPFQLLRELILHTSQRASEGDPREMQTGPAARGDRRTIEEHLERLREKPQLRALYRELSERILKEQHGNDEL